jgi:hypothetical protein
MSGLQLDETRQNGVQCHVLQTQLPFTVYVQRVYTCYWTCACPCRCCLLLLQFKVVLHSRQSSLHVNLGCAVHFLLQQLI